MSERIVTGVIHNHSASWLVEELHDALDPDYEQHCATCPNEYHDNCWESIGSETLLLGFVKSDSREDAWFEADGVFYTIDDTDAEYSAIVGEIYTQIVRSRWVAECARCSPCYPNQGDLDTPGGDYLAYCFPPSMFDTEVDEFDVGRIREVGNDV